MDTMIVSKIKRMQIERLVKEAKRLHKTRDYSLREIGAILDRSYEWVRQAVSVHK